MKVLITGICGFVGNALAHYLLSRSEDWEIFGLDTLLRPGSEVNRQALRSAGVHLFHADIRQPSDLAELPRVDWVIDAAGSPSVLAGMDGEITSRQLMEHNLMGAINLLEYCQISRVGLILLSSSRVYSVPALAALPLRTERHAFVLDTSAPLPRGLTAAGIGPQFSTESPVSLYGATKRASELMALEYGAAFGFPVWINRCGVVAGAGQFGTSTQGIFAYWIHSHLRQRTLRYCGFGGTGYQVRDVLHPSDLAALIDAQMKTNHTGGSRIYTVGGGLDNACSLAQLTNWCETRFGHHSLSDPLADRPFDIPWVVMDGSDAAIDFGWSTQRNLHSILEEIAVHAEAYPDWLQLSAPL